MLTTDQSRRLFHKAYLPEHLTDYVTAVADLDPVFFDECLCYVHRQHLHFIGYPVFNRTGDVKRAFDAAIRDHQPRNVSIIAPDVRRIVPHCTPESTDQYYGIDLPVGGIDPGVAYMVRRAEKELTVSEGIFATEHRDLVEIFLQTRKVSEGHRLIFRRLDRYLTNSRTAVLLEARRHHRLAAFTIVDVGSSDYGFYMFNCRSPMQAIPGASDLLFSVMLQRCQQMGKKAINLGLAMSAGNRRFKEKWGGKPILPYQSAVIHREKFDWHVLSDMMRRR